MKKLPSVCPSCGGHLTVRRMACQKCGTQIEGQFELPLLVQLPTEDQEFIIQFVKASGSLKEMAQLLHLSYPTVRNKLNDIIERCVSLEGNEAGKERSER
jgi:hypothetical protein